MANGCHDVIQGLPDVPGHLAFRFFSLRSQPELTFLEQLGCLLSKLADQACANFLQSASLIPLRRPNIYVLLPKPSFYSANKHRHKLLFHPTSTTTFRYQIQYLEKLANS